MKAFIYTRVSTADQANEGVSLEAQRARAEAWAVASGYEVHPEVFIDAGISGKRADNRPALQSALSAACKSNGGALVVYSLSRLARSTRDAIDIAERLRKSGADLVSMSEKIDTTSASGKMVFRMLAVLAEFERDLVSERTRAALSHKASKGERVGNLPWGHRLADDGIHLLRDDREQRIMQRIGVLRASGRTWQSIAEELNTSGIMTKQGRPFTWQTARKAVA